MTPREASARNAIHARCERVLRVYEASCGTGPHPRRNAAVRPVLKRYHDTTMDEILDDAFTAVLGEGRDER